MRKLYSPSYGLLHDVVPISKGGTSSKTPEKAATSLGLLTNSLVGANNGVATLTGNYLTESQLPASITAKTHVTGSDQLVLNLPTRFAISNYDSKKTYQISVPADLVLSGRNNEEFYLESLTTGDKTFSVNNTSYTLTVKTVTPLKPEIVTPVHGGTDLLQEVTISFTNFKMPTGFETQDTHNSTDWQISTNGSFTTILQESLNDSINLTSWKVSNLLPNTTYYVRARYKGVKTGKGEWGQLDIPDPQTLVTSYKFSTKTSFVASSLEQQIQTADTVGDEYLGTALALTADGVYCFVTSPGHESTGAVFVYRRNNSIWSLVATLKPTDVPVTGNWGHSLAISAYGEVVLISGAGANSVYCYTKVGSSWSYRQTLTDNYGGTQAYGYSLSVSGDANTCCISQRDYDSAKGAVHVYIRNGDTWVFQIRISVDDGALYDYFGESCSLSYDGNTLAVGAKGRSSKGAVYVYRRVGGVWSQQAYLIGSTTNSSVGISVSVSSSGNTLVTGAPYINSSRGAAYIYSFNGSTWVLEKSLAASLNGTAETGLGMFGYSVAMAPNGLSCVVGAISRNSNGAVYIFTKSGTNWVQQQRLLPPPNLQDGYFGYSVAIVNNAWLVLASAPYAADPGNALGSVCAFV